MATEQEVLEALREIIDPDLGRDIVSLGFIKNLQIDGAQVAFAVELTTPSCPLKARFQKQAEDIVAKLPGVETVQVTMTAMESKRPQREVEALKSVDAVVAVSACKGGVGKSTVASYLARALQREGKSVGLLDLDIFGPSLPTLFRVSSPDIIVENEMLLPVEIDGLKTMSLGYLLGDRPAVMRGPMVSGYIQQILHQTNWGELDVLLIDLPPGTGDIQLTLVQHAPLDGAIIVSTPQSLSLVDVAKGILMFEKVDVPVLGLVENMAHFECDGCGKKHHIFGNATETLQERFGLTTLAELPLVPGMSDVSSRNAGADQPAFATLAEQMHREIGKRRMTELPKPEVTIEPGAVCIRWPEGGESRIPSKLLRTSCRCAHCVDEYTGEELLDPTTVPDDIEAISLEVLGNYAISITWSDNHSYGIYTWARLKRIAEQAEG